MRRFLLVVLALLLFAPAVSAGTYIMKPKYRVVALDAETGEKLWKAKPEKLPEPELRVSNNVLLARGKLSSLSSSKEDTSENGDETVRHFIDVENGALLENQEKLPDGETTGPLEPLPRNVTGPFKSVAGHTEHLANQKNTENKEGEKTKIKQNPEATFGRRLPVHPRYVHIVNNLAIFGFSKSNYGGEAFAYDLEENKLKWEFDPKRRFPKLKIPATAYTSIDIDGDRVLVQSDQNLFALNAKTGKVIWKTQFPRQNIRRYDSAWTRIGRKGNALYVACYEMLLKLRRTDGKILWHYNCGSLGEPWPTIADGRVFVSIYKSGAAQKVSATPGGETKTKPNTVAVIRDDKAPAGYRLKLLQRHEVPEKASIYWSLHPASSSDEQKNTPNLTLRFSEDKKVDLGTVVAEKGRAYAKFPHWIDRIELLVDGELVKRITIED